MGRGLFLGVLVWCGVGQVAFALDLEFVAASADYRTAADEYREIWSEDGDRIVRGLNEETGLTLGESRIRVIVHEGISRSGLGDRPMRLRASYPTETKRATLVHELGHRYLVVLDSDTRYSDVHYPLSLLLHRVWSDLWGEAFAQEQAQVETERSSRYRRAWDWTLSMPEKERTAKWQEFINGAQAQSSSQD